VAITVGTFRENIHAFVEAFNADDLDKVMTMFSEDAQYEPGDGNVWQGKAAIRAAFAPQFDRAFGKMRFDVLDTVVDEATRKLALTWICRHDLHGAKLSTFSRRLQRLAVGFLYGPTFGWHGVDVFVFDAMGQIMSKRSFANYGTRPQLRKDLGVPLIKAS
jgi:ketosteroid isomerase-like protein